MEFTPELEKEVTKEVKGFIKDYVLKIPNYDQDQIACNEVRCFKF